MKLFLFQSDIMVESSVWKQWTENSEVSYTNSWKIRELHLVTEKWRYPVLMIENELENDSSWLHS